MSYQVAYGDRYLLTKLASDPFSGCVHSVFAHALNFQDNQSGELFTLAHPKIKGGPNTLIVKEGPIFSSRFKPGMPVSLVKGYLFFDSVLSFSLEQAEEIDYHLTKQAIDFSLLLANCQGTLTQLSLIAMPGSFYGSPLELNDYQLVTQQALQQRARRLVNELTTQQWPRAVRTAKGLIGLGPGLTPAGDDFLLGLITVLQLPDFPTDVYKDWIKAVVELSVDGTNIISFTGLKKAAEGQVKATLNQWLISVISSSNHQEQMRTLEAVLAIGSTSGVDTIIGVIYGLQLLMNLKGESEGQLLLF